MSYFAKLDQNNRVIFVTRGRAEDDGRETELSTRTGDTYKQTSYNTRGGVHYDPETGQPSEDQSKALRFNFAGQRYLYDPERDAFIPPKPFHSWVLDEKTCLYVAPEPMPDDSLSYTWDELSLSWVAADK